MYCKKCALYKHCFFHQLPHWVYIYIGLKHVWKLQSLWIQFKFKLENHHLLLHNKYIWLSYIGKKKRNIVETCNEISYDTTSQLVLVPIIQKWVTGVCSIGFHGSCVFLWNCKLPLTIRNTREEGSVHVCVCVCVRACVRVTAAEYTV